MSDAPETRRPSLVIVSFVLIGPAVAAAAFLVGQVIAGALSGKSLGVELSAFVLFAFYSYVFASLPLLFCSIGIALTTRHGRVGMISGAAMQALVLSLCLVAFALLHPDRVKDWFVNWLGFTSSILASIIVSAGILAASTRRWQ
jgi:hypothetical protein